MNKKILPSGAQSAVAPANVRELMQCVPAKLPCGIHTQTVFVNPILAREILTELEYRGQRRLRSEVVAKYAREAILGRWRIDQPLKIARLGQHAFLVDGQHRMEMVCMTGLGQTFPVIWVDCQSDSEVADAYNSAGGGAPRTEADALAASGLIQRLELSSTWFNPYKSAVKVILTEFSASTRPYSFSEHDIAARMETLRPHFECLRETIKGTPLQKHLRWSGVMATALCTWEVDDEAAWKFWRAVATNSNDFKITQLLGQRLMMDYKQFSAAHTSRLCANAWKRWRQNPHSSAKVLAPQAISQPFALCGHPKFTGTQQPDYLQLELG